MERTQLKMPVRHSVTEPNVSHPRTTDAITEITKLRPGVRTVRDSRALFADSTTPLYAESWKCCDAPFVIMTACDR
jgi:hypothetical protein